MSRRVNRWQGAETGRASIAEIVRRREQGRLARQRELESFVERARASAPAQATRSSTGGTRERSPLPFMMQRGSTTRRRSATRLTNGSASISLSNTTFRPPDGVLRWRRPEGGWRQEASSWHDESSRDRLAEASLWLDQLMNSQTLRSTLDTFAASTSSDSTSGTERSSMSNRNDGERRR